MSLHDHLKGLLPCDFDSVPEDEKELAQYIRDAVAKAQKLVDSVPPPAPTSSSSDGGSSVTGAASSGDQVTRSDAVSEALGDEEMRKAWGKPMKLSAKDNPYQMAVYKMAAKDRRGAWFARRSVHEGLGFARWKKGLDSEFDDSLKVHGKPGEGNVRGIGGEKKVTVKEVPGVGKMSVFHLTAQFPGPSAPRDFVELLISSTEHPTDKEAPRQYLLISKPVKHSEVPEVDGFVRGEYESVEFIREVPIRKTKMMSTSSLPATVKSATRSTEQTDDPKKLGRAATDSEVAETKSSKIVTEHAEAMIEARQAQDDVAPKAIESAQDAKDSDNDSGVAMAVDENDDLAPNPVEWIMITRSDPGGSVPRFMVERGTPGAIVSDASKFLQWATTRQIPTVVEGGDAEADTETPLQDGGSGGAAGTSTAMATAAARQAHTLTRTMTVVSTSSSSSSDSFVSADSVPAPKRKSTGISKYDHQEHEIVKKLGERKSKAETQLEETREKHPDNASRIQKAVDKRDRKVSDAEKWHDKEMGKVQQRREKAAKKERESGSKKDLREKIEVLTNEVEVLKQRVQELEGAK